MSKARNLSKLLDDNGDILIENLDNVSVGFGDLTTTPTTLTGYGITDAATSAQGALADSAVQPGDNISGLTNDSGYATTTYVDTAESDAVTTANAYTDSALAGISSDAITEGNSSVEVVDTGTGYVAVTVDGSETARFDASGNLGVGTTSDGSIGHFKNATGNATLKVEGGTTAGNDAYTNIEIGNTTGTSGVFFSDTTNGVGRITYEHNGDYMRMYTASTERMRIDSSGNLKFNSGYGSVATAYGCRAFVNFDGTGSVSIRRAGNVSSITDNGSGDYTINFSTSMVDDDYTSASMGRVWPAVQSEGFCVAHANYSNDGQAQRTTSSLRIAVLNHVANLYDSPSICVSIFR